MAKSNAVWGIDIGQCALKALRCTLDADGQSVVADSYDYIEYPKILSQPEADPEELVRQALEQFLSRNQVLGDSVAISVPGQAGLSRFFKPPPVDAKTLPDIVKYEVKQQIPFPIEEVIWDWQQMGGTIVDGRTVDAEVGLFAMKRDAVIRALRPFDEADVEVDIIQLSPLSIFNVVCKDILDEMPSPEDFDPESPPHSVVVMSMGTDTTDLIVSNGIKLWLRNIPIGGNHFTKQLSRELKLTQAKAEHLKRNARQAEDPKTVFKAMRPVFSDLVNEVQRSLTFFQSMDKTAKISKIVLLGNAAKLPGLRQFLNKQLQIDIAKISEFDSLNGTDVISQQSFKDNLLAFAPSYGLCLQGAGKGVMNTNLLPGEIVKERIIRAKKPWVLASVGLLMIGMMLGYFMKDTAWWKVNPSYQAENVTWEKAKKEIDLQDSSSKRYKREDDEQKIKLDKMNRLAAELVASSEDKSSWTEIQSAIYQSLPKDPKLENLESVDPSEYAFSDRKELYLDHIETKYYIDVGEWLGTVKPIHDTMFESSTADLAALLQPIKEAAEEAAVDTASEITGDGWVIEIKAHHFHNSDEKVLEMDATKAYILRTLLTTLIDGTVEFPGNEDGIEGGGQYKFQDFGIYYPTLVTSSERQKVGISFRQDSIGRDPEEEGSYEGSYEREGPSGPGGAGGDGTEPNGQFDAWRYDFTIQMAWIPRTPRERFEAKMLRVEAEAKKASTQADAANEETEEEN
ncbi:MAG: type IV pilus assembly protein PilM [Mariniblastus sp.]|nr:type IV pilus assembly protein PilM [Mariniblastus sp.]